MGAAIPFAPMIIGAGAGALIDKQNPLRGAMLGAVGGGVAGPAMAGITGAGAAAASEAAAMGAAPGAAASYGAAGGLAGIGPQQAAMLASQTAEFGGPGLAHTLGSAGLNAPMSKLAAFGTMGPQSFMSGLTGKDFALKAGQGLLNMGGQQQPPPMASAPSVPRQTLPPPQPMSPFSTGMMAQRRPARIIDPFGRSI